MSRKIKYIAAVMVFGLLAAVFLFLNKTDNVFWEIYAFTLKDSLIISLISIEFIHNKNITSRLVSIGLGSYLIMPFFIRFFCAYRSGMNYELYRKLLSNESYRFLLTLVLFAIITMIYMSFKNESGRN
jgi:ABC-type cobalamin transport system permease subunit